MLLYELKENETGEQGYEINPFSGNERNRLFLQSQGNFLDATTVSGIDFRQDGRGFVLFDYDRDGWLDMGITSAQSPRFRIVRNQLGERKPAEGNQSVWIRLVGGQKDLDAQTEWSSRDPIGAELSVTVDSQDRAFLYSCGEGLSSQNSGWIHVGQGQSEMIDRITVRWPSGKQSTVEQTPAGSRIVLFENEQESGR